MPKSIEDNEFINLWNRAGGKANHVAEVAGISVRSVYERRRSIEEKHGVRLQSSNAVTPNGACSEKTIKAFRLDKLAEHRQSKYEREIHLDLNDGVVMIGSDCHYWPMIVTKAHQAFCAMAKKLKPSVVILNGDVLDGARISRHSRDLWQKQPTLKDELIAVQDRCAEIQRAAGGAALIRTIGNHDSRFERYLCENVPELEEMTGSTLLDYLPDWRAGWAVHINSNQEGWTVIRHRPVSGGVHSAYNSVLRAGVNYVHGHLHKLEYKPWTDYRGTSRYGVDCGTMAEPSGEQFDYTEGGPLNWRSGFFVLTFRDGVLLPPEPCIVQGGRAWFRAEEV